MIKFLKFVLFVIVVAFAFALGVKFSDSFKGNIGNLRDDEVKIENEMDKAFNEVKKEVRGDVSTEVARPLTEEERNEVNRATETMPEYVDIEIVEPMDGVIDNTQVETTTPDNAVVPTQSTTSGQPNQVPAQPNQVPAPVAPAPAKIQQPVPAQAKQPTNAPAKR